MKQKWKEPPLWLVNWITIISGAVTVLTPIVGAVVCIYKKINITTWYIITLVILLLFLLIVFLRMRKYAIIENKRMKEVSSNYYLFLHRAKNLFFETMHSHKTNSLNAHGLTKTYQSAMTIMLEDLCNVMNSYTGQKIDACIKLISYPIEEEIIDRDNATLITFCRSPQSETGRGDYENKLKSEIRIKDNTDFLDIIDNENDKDYFYQNNLLEYDEELKRTGSKYRNTNEYWFKSYKGTAVVPIKIEFKKLYHQKKNDAYHIIGFLCIDSLSTEAFSDKQEKYNVGFLQSFAEVIYVLLAQYRHYLKKLSK